MECLNSNSCLNSIICMFFKKKILLLYSFFLLPISGLLCFEPRLPKSGRAPQFRDLVRRHTSVSAARFACGPVRPSRVRRRPLRLTGGSRPSSPTSGRVRLGQGPLPELVLRASMAPRPAHRGAVYDLFKGRLRNAAPPFAPNPSAPEPPPPTLTLARRRRCSARPPPPSRRGHPLELCVEVRITPVSLVHAPVPRFAPHALAVGRRRASSAPPHGPPPPSSTRPPECLRSTQRVASFAPVQVLSKTVPSTQRLGRLARVPPRAAARRRASCRRCAASAPIAPAAVRSGLGDPDRL
jgi:hypothetical protein